MNDWVIIDQNQLNKCFQQHHGENKFMFYEDDATCFVLDEHTEVDILVLHL